MSTRLLLARHAETVWHQENRYAGARSEPPLSEAGLRQADTLARGAVAAGVRAVVSSPQPRAVRTATPAAEAIGVSVAIMAGLHEVDFGSQEGRTIAEADPEEVRRFREDPVANAFPGSEPPLDAAARACAALREIDAAHDGSTVLVVAHNTLLRLALCTLLGLPAAHYRRVFPRLDNVAVTEVQLPADPTHPAALISLNRAL